MKHETPFFEWKAVVAALGCLPEVEVKSLLLKRPCISDIEPGGSELIWLA